MYKFLNFLLTSALVITAQAASKKLTEEQKLKLISFQGEMILNQQSQEQATESMILGQFVLPKSSQVQEVQKLTDFISQHLNERTVGQMYFGTQKGEFMVITQNKDTEYDSTYHVIFRTKSTGFQPLLFAIKNVKVDRIEFDSEQAGESLWFSKSIGTFLPVGQK